MASADILRAAHSPLPWTLAPNCRRGNKIQCRDPDGAAWPWDVATCYIEAPADRTGKNNAAFIVRACNAHYQMLEALKKAQAALDFADFPEVMKVVRAAIAAAEREAGQ